MNGIRAADRWHRKRAIYRLTRRGLSLSRARARADFKNAGYLALGAGKLYHSDNPPNHDVPRSWSPERTADLAELGPQTGPEDGQPIPSCNLSIPGEQACYYEPEWQRCVQALRHHFGPFLTSFSALYRPSRAALCGVLSLVPMRIEY